MKKSKSQHLKLGRNFDVVKDQYKDWPISTILELLQLMMRAESVADPFGVVEEVLAGAHGKIFAGGDDAKSLLNAFYGLLNGKEKEALLKYVDFYLPYRLNRDQFVFSQGKLKQANRNCLVGLNLSDILNNISFNKNPIISVFKFISESPKLAEVIAKDLLPHEFGSIGYHQYGSQAKKNRRRIALRETMFKKASNAQSYLLDAPGSPRRAASIAETLIKSIHIMKKNDASVDLLAKAWKEDILFLRSEFYDSVLHLQGVKWPQI
jgi:hypothetical protein